MIEIVNSYTNITSSWVALFLVMGLLTGIYFLMYLIEEWPDNVLFKSTIIAISLIDIIISFHFCFINPTRVYYHVIYWWEDTTFKEFNDYLKENNFKLIESNGKLYTVQQIED